MKLGCISTALPLPLQTKTMSAKSAPVDADSIGETPLADRPTAAGHPVGVKATQTAAFVAMEGPELYQYSPNGYLQTEKRTDAVVQC